MRVALYLTRAQKWATRSVYLPVRRSVAPTFIAVSRVRAQKPWTRLSGLIGIFLLIDASWRGISGRCECRFFGPALIQPKWHFRCELQWNSVDADEARTRSSDPELRSHTTRIRPGERVEKWWSGTASIRRPPVFQTSAQYLLDHCDQEQRGQTLDSSSVC